MKRLILHIGTHKTGTSSLQEFLSDNVEALGQLHWCFPTMKSRYQSVKANRNGHFLSLDTMMKLGETTNPSGISNLVAKDIAYLKELVRTHDNILLSDEQLWAEGSKNPDFWKTLRETLHDIGIDRVDIIVYLRRQDLFVTSLWNQSVKGVTRMRAKAPKFSTIAKIGKIMDYDSGLRQLEEAFGPEHIIVRVYDRSLLEGGDVRRDFCTAVGIESTSDFSFEAEGVNEGLTSTVADIKREANRSQSYRSTDNFLSQSAIAASQLFRGDDNASPLSPERRRELLDHYATGNARIARDYFGRDDGVLFPVPDKLPDAWSFNPEVYARDAVLFFTDAIAREHSKRLEAEMRVQRLEVKVADLEKQVKNLNRRTAKQPSKQNIFTRIRKKVFEGKKSPR